MIVPGIFYFLKNVIIEEELLPEWELAESEDEATHVLWVDGSFDLQYDEVSKKLLIEVGSPEFHALIKVHVRDCEEYLNEARRFAKKFKVEIS